MPKKTACLTFIAALCFCFWPSLLAAQGNAVQVLGSEYAAAVNLIAKDIRIEGRIFVADSTLRVRAVIVLVDYTPFPFTQDLFYDDRWRMLSQTCECALLYARLAPIRPFDPNTAVANQYMRNAAVGGADALILLLQRIGEESAHHELRGAPILFWGWSATASFGTTFAEVHPERTIAFIRYHTHRRGLSEDVKVLKNIPALLVAGGKDEMAGVEDTETFWMTGRSAGAPWTLATEPDATHDSYEALSQTANDLMIPWMAAVLRLRVAPDSARLRPVTDDTGWLGNNHTAEVAPHVTFVGPKAEASWLPDEATARGWQTVLRVAK